MSEVLRIKNDVLNELRNQKYYTQDELKFTIDDSTKTQKQKVEKVISIADELVRLDSKITLVENIFVDTAQAQPMAQPMAEPAPETNDELSDAPDNIVEAVVTELNAKGQSHSE